ncbi:MAG: lipoate--protein ligase family protein [Anaerolineae bacterium]|nr:lipoate--protein ligase family protein [Anaerolineae bacterium]
MSYTIWRLLLTGTADGAMNMAVDQAIMEAVANDETPPTLRFYAWEPPCLSLGYTQPIADVDHERLSARGWGLVRRITGGRAILHADELTYSVAVKASDPIVAGGIVQSYRRLSQPLLHSMQNMETDAHADKLTQRHPDAKGPVCFEVPSHYEITVSGKKLVGSAQVRKFGAVLQHGSFPLTGDITRIVDALVFENNDKRETIRSRVRQRAATLRDVTGQLVTWEQAAQRVAASFQDVFDLTFVTEKTLTPQEKTRADELRASQYATDEWNARF